VLTLAVPSGLQARLARIAVETSRRDCGRHATPVPVGSDSPPARFRVGMLSFSFSRRLAPRHTQVCDATRSRLCFLAALQERSAAYLRSARYPLPFALSRRQLRGIAQVRMLPAPSLLSRGTFEASAAYSGLHATQLRLCFLAAFRSLRDITQVWMLPACLCSLVAPGSTAYLRSARYPLLSLFSRGFSKASTTSSGLDVTRLPLLSRGAWLHGVLRSARYPASSLLSRGFSKRPRHHSGVDVTRLPLLSRGAWLHGVSQVCTLPAFVFVFSWLFKSFHDILRSGCYPPAFAFSRRLAPRRPLVCTLPASFVLSWRQLHGILRSECYPLPSGSRGV